MSERTPTFVEVLQNVQRDLQDQIRTVVPGVVVSYNAAQQTCAIQPAPRLRVSSGEHVDLAQIADAPVAFPSGAGFAITWPLLPGNKVLVLCSDRGIARWRTTGTPYTPGDRRRHSLSDAFVWPGAGPAPSPAKAASPTDLVIEGPGGVPMVRVTPTGAQVTNVSLTAWIAAVNAFLLAIAPGFNATPAGTPVVSLGTGGVVPPPATDFDGAAT